MRMNRWTHDELVFVIESTRSYNERAKQLKRSVKAVKNVLTIWNLLINKGISHFIGKMYSLSTLEQLADIAKEKGIEVKDVEVISLLASTNKVTKLQNSNSVTNPSNEIEKASKKLEQAFMAFEKEVADSIAVVAGIRAQNLFKEKKLEYEKRINELEEENRELRVLKEQAQHSNVWSMLTKKLNGAL